MNCIMAYFLRQIDISPHLLNYYSIGNSIDIDLLKGRVTRPSPKVCPIFERVWTNILGPKNRLGQKN